MRSAFPSDPPPSRFSARVLLREAAQSLLAVALPSPCSLCGKEIVELTRLGMCRECREGLEPWTGTICARCGLPIAADPPEGSGAFLCGPCRTETFHFDLARAYGLYRGSLRGVILQLKFRRRERFARKLGSFLADVWQAEEGIVGAEDPLIVPVPLHPSRERERGFNQSWLLAQALRRFLSAAAGAKRPGLERRLLARVRATTPQTGLSPSARRENVRGVFEARRPDQVRGRSIVLVDDVMTTGATLSACAAALKAAGAAQVFALAVARATPQFPDTVLPRARVVVDARVAEQT